METNRRRVFWEVPTGILILVGIIYADVLNFDFTNSDERFQVLENPLIRSLDWSNLLKIFSTFNIHSYYPIRLLSFAIDYKIWGINPAGFHLTNLLIHCSNVLLLYFFLIKKLPGYTIDKTTNYSILLSLSFFAFHPVAVEPVAWVAGREELLALFFILCALHTYTSSLSGAICSVPVKGMALYVFAVAACLSNVLGAITPLLLTAYNFSFPEKPESKNIAYKIAGTAPLWIISAGTVLLKKFGGTGITTLEEIDIYTHILTLFQVFYCNVKALFLPINLSFLYSAHTPVGFFEYEVMGGVFFSILLFFAIAHCKKTGLLFFGILWVLISLAPTSQLIRHHIFNADRFLYIPMAGITFILSSTFTHFLPGKTEKQKKVNTLIFTSFILFLWFLGIKSSFQLQHWQNSISLFSHVLEKNPWNHVAQHNLASGFMKEGFPKQAITHYRKSILIKPDLPESYIGLGLAFIKQNKIKEAVEAYNKGLAFEPDSADLHYNLGYAYSLLNMQEKALGFYQTARNIRPFVKNEYINLGITLTTLGQYGEASDHFKNALALDPDSANANYHMGILQEEIKKDKEAISSYSRALKNRPHSIELRIKLGQLFTKTEKPKEAIKQYKEILTRSPFIEKVCVNLGILLMTQGKIQEAIGYLKQALSLKPDSPFAHYNMGVALAQTGSIKKATHHFTEALNNKPGFEAAKTQLQALRER